jgi:hypothetical protein
MSSAGTVVEQRLDLQNAIYSIGQAYCFTFGCIQMFRFMERYGLSAEAGYGLVCTLTVGKEIH